MILYETFNNHLEAVLPEFFLTTILLVLLLYGVFYKYTVNSQKIIIIKNINTIIIYLLLILFILTFNNSEFQLNLFNGVLINNAFTQFIKLILIGCTIINFIIQKKYIINQKIYFYEINILLLISLLALMLLISSNNFITLYLAIELQSLSFYILTASQTKSILSIEAALKYFILGSIASGFILFGSSIIYASTGTLNYNNISLILSNVDFNTNTDLLIGVLYGFGFILIGLLFKIGIAPFHFWLPDVYEGAPNNVSAFFAITPKIAFFGLLIRFFLDVFYDISFFFEMLLYIVSILSMIIGSLGALQQKKIKRLLAYSSISHVGFILIGFTTTMFSNIPYILFYIIIYIIMTINLWTSYLSLYIDCKPVKYLTDLSNLFSTNKFLAIIIAINMFSLAGIPPLAGFFSKLFIFITAIQNNEFSLIFFAVIISIISSFYYLKLIKIIFFEQKYQIRYVDKIQKSNSYILIIGTQFILFLFIFPNLILVPITNIYLTFFI